MRRVAQADGGGDEGDLVHAVPGRRESVAAAVQTSPKETSSDEEQSTERH